MKISVVQPCNGQINSMGYCEKCHHVSQTTGGLCGQLYEIPNSAQPVEGEKEDKPDCLNHKKEVVGITDMKALAEMVGDLHYETLSQFLWELQSKIHEDGMKDLKAERFKIAQTLMRASRKIYYAMNEIEQAWQISKPFMSTTDAQGTEPRPPKNNSEDVYNKVSCLIGYLEMWKMGRVFPNELTAVINEANEWLEKITTGTKYNYQMIKQLNNGK